MATAVDKESDLEGREEHHGVDKNGTFRIHRATWIKVSLKDGRDDRRRH